MLPELGLCDSLRRVRSLLLLPVLLAASCAPEGPPARTQQAEWRSVGSWSGRGNAQLGVFIIDGQQWRVVWEAKNESPEGQGYLKVTAHSADSGRVLEEPVDHRGVGRGVTKAFEEHPRRYYFTVTSANVDWTLTAEQPTVLR
jgi:hypothetical protein